MFRSIARKKFRAYLSYRVSSVQLYVLHVRRVRPFYVCHVSMITFEVDAYVFSGTLTAVYVCICGRRNMRRSYPWRGHTWMRTACSRHVTKSACESEGRGRGWSFISTGKFSSRVSVESADAASNGTAAAAGIPLPTRENQSGILRGVTACFTILNHAGLLSSYHPANLFRRDTDSNAVRYNGRRPRGVVLRAKCHPWPSKLICHLHSASLLCT